MSRLARTPLLCLALLLVGAPGPAAVVIHEYALRGTLADNLSGSPLVPLGGQIDALGYVFAANQGLLLSSPLLDPASFSLEFSFKLDAVSGYRKLADFHDRGDDTGFYVLNGALNFYPVATASTADFLPGVDVHAVLTRDAGTNVVNGYVNGQLRFTFSDTSPLATLTSADHKLTLFADDFNTSQGESSGGTVNYVRLFNGALTPTEVSTLAAAGRPQGVPEPPPVALLALGLPVLAGIAAWHRRRTPSVDGGRHPR